MEKEYIEVTDNSSHRYIIPYDNSADWDKFMEIPEDDESSWDLPGFAERVDGGQIIFKNYRIG